MKQLAHSTPEAQKGEKRGEIRRHAPLLAVMAGSAALVFTPLEGSAQQAPRAQCSASVQTGEMSPLTSKGRASRLVSQPLLEANKYVSLALPNSYVDELVRAAKARPEAERESFVGNGIRRNLEAVISQMGPSKTRVTIQCIPVSSLTAQPQPQPAPQPAKRPAPQPESGTKAPAKASPAPEPAKTVTEPDEAAPAPAPAPQPPSEGGARRRVIQPGGKSEPAPKAAVPKADTPKPEPAKTMAPLPPSRKGGSGSEKDPYVVEVPVPVKAQLEPGTKLSTHTFPYLVTGEDGSVKIHVSIRFVSGKGGFFQTSKSMLAGSIIPYVTGIMSAAMRENHLPGSPNSSSVVASVNRIVEQAKENSPQVRQYAP